MGEITVKGKNVESGQVNEIENQMLMGALEIVGSDYSREKILKTIRALPKNSNPGDMMEELVNRLIDANQDEAEDVFVQHGPINRATSPNNCTDIVPLINPSSNTGIKEETDPDMQKAINASLKSSHSSASGYMLSLPDDLEVVIRNPNLSTGLFNTGNTCWFNCVAQILFHIPKFRSIVYHCVPLSWCDEDLEQLNVENCQTRYLLLKIRRLFADMQFSTVSYIDTTSVLEVINLLTKKQCGQEFVLGQQQDATESLIRIIDWMETGMNEALEHRLNPYILVEEEEEDDAEPVIEKKAWEDGLADYVPAGSTATSPNSDVCGTSPPAYDDITMMEGTSTQDVSELRKNKQSIRNSPSKQNENGVRRGFEKSSSSKDVRIDEPMDTEGEDESVAKKPKMRQKMEPVEVSEEEKQGVEDIKRNMEEIFAATCFTTTYSPDNASDRLNNEVRNCPQFFHLQVSYGNLHDALEASTFDTGRISTRVENWFDKLPAAIFMGISRFGYNNGSPEKLHTKFVFPQVLYMDRYLKKNEELVQELRRKQFEYRESLARSRALYKGLQEYPHASNQSTRIIDAFETVYNVLTRKTNSEPPLSEETKAILAPCLPPNDYSLNSLFVPDMGKTFPALLPKEFPNIELCANTISNIAAKLKEREEEFQSMERELSDRIKAIYERKELHECEYKLHAVIIHSGEATRGHYWMYSRVHSQSSFELDTWEKLNDKNSEMVSWEQVEGDAFGTGSSNSPSAYCLLYTRSDANWLMEPDALTREEALECLPNDLREMVDTKATDFTTNLTRFRAEKAEKDRLEVQKVAQEKWERKRPKTKIYPVEMRSFKDGDENANPTMNDFSEISNLLYQQSDPVIGSDDMRKLQDSTERLWSMVNKTVPHFFGTPRNVLDHHLQYLMDHSGFDHLEFLVGYKVKNLPADAENDINNVYNEFIKNFWAYCVDKSVNPRSNVFLFVKNNIHQIPIKVLRFILVGALQITNAGPISKKAKEELEEYKKRYPDSYKSVDKVSQWCAVLFELLSITIHACNESLTNYELVPTDEKIFAEFAYTKLSFARIARSCYHQINEESRFLEVPILNEETTIKYVIIQFATIFPLLRLFKSILTYLLANNNRSFDLSFLDAKTSKRIEKFDFAKEVAGSLIFLKSWAKNGSSDSDVTKFCSEALDCLKNTFELAVGMPIVTASEDKNAVARIISKELYNDEINENFQIETMTCDIGNIIQDNYSMNQIYHNMSQNDSMKQRFDNALQEIQTKFCEFYK